MIMMMTTIPTRPSLNIKLDHPSNTTLINTIDNATGTTLDGTTL